MALRAAASDSPTAIQLSIDGICRGCSTTRDPVWPSLRTLPYRRHGRRHQARAKWLPHCRARCAVDHGHQSPLMAKENQRSARVGTIEDHPAGMDQHHHDCWCEIPTEDVEVA